ncbi:class I SAM-dependent methyltransferase [Terriglobus roseus]|uniref:class I SAM-dependent methyltransferase n=1 Tax=Terriglobus roseus TaxID=392734 RepID=UPI0002E344A4|nr:methyltransferase domain-containing protein [Terriglobus roseus]
MFLAGSIHAQTPQAQRHTSAPYAGDLSIFEEPGREEKLQINRVMDILHITPGKAVADIGAGGGWFSVRAARRVGEGGKVYAEDINPAAVKAIDARAAKEHLPQVKAVLGTTDDPKLPEKSVDAVLMLKVYHEIAEPLGFLAKLKPALAPGARVGIIDRNGTGTDHGLSRAFWRRRCVRRASARWSTMTSPRRMGRIISWCLRCVEGNWGHVSWSRSVVVRFGDQDCRMNRLQL